MSRYPPGPSVPPTIIPPQALESKRDRKRRETINKIEMLHDESWRGRDERFQQLYREYHLENKAINSQPPTSAKYLLRLYPMTVERDALLESAEVEYQYKESQAKKMYQSERESIEAQYWDAREQVRQRFLGAIEERRRKLREEKEGGDVVTETLLEAQIKPRPTRRLPLRNHSSTSTRNSTPLDIAPPLISIPPEHVPNGTQTKDLLLHSLLAPTLAAISVDDILTPNSTSLIVTPATTGPAFQPGAGKRGPRGKGDASGDKETISAAPGTLTALAIASGQQPAVQPKTSRGAGAQGQWVLGKSLAELKKMESASQLEIESDWARIQGATGRGRRTRGE